jgi:hypothetical protein
MIIPTSRTLRVGQALSPHLHSPGRQNRVPSSRAIDSMEVCDFI